MRSVAALVLAVHLAWILWVIFGTRWTRGRPVLAAVHIISIVWGMIVELSPVGCPLTIAEQFFETRAGVPDPYRGGFLIHYLDLTVYPDLPEPLLVCFGVGVCALNLAIYARRYWRLLHRNARS